MWMRSVVMFLLLYQVSNAQNTSVLILARGGSKGIRLKNLSIVGGISLLARSILTARAAGFEDIIVSTDHPLIALEALKYNARVFKRSHATSTDWAPSMWGVSEYINTRADIDILILLQATSPFVKAKHLTLSIQKLDNPNSFDCIFSVTRSYKLRWNYNKLGIYPVNFEYNNRPRRQDWFGELLETGAFYICRNELIKKGYLQNNK
ncbi:N-acylneuraminate cytidylyltransferase A [Maniola jurtina]|uniref:N-acylneuraminate cytidylyltransferase A n=1 Tax=Maniola jurtina TaxID=191418 RepID=UPI001E68F6DA|nr:N-acylneuraminate cytidylyltransferase A [Maniola jurtina]